MRVAVTGAHGFLGWHLQAALQQRGDQVFPIALGRDFDLTVATAAIEGSSRVIHLAGVNRASDNEISEGNVGFASQLALALRAAATPPHEVVFANSIQSSNDTVYGIAKREAAGILEAVSTDLGTKFVNVMLPNLFGEHGRPFYNAVTSTFSHLIARGEQPTVETDRELQLLHAQNAADVLSGALSATEIGRLQRVETVSGLLRRLKAYADLYRVGEIPDVADPYDRDLFNTYRSYTFPHQSPIHLHRHADDRGAFFEIIRSHGGSGQSSFSTTAPGVSRGDHYHRRKIERFTVLQGRAEITLRRLNDTKVMTFPVSGDKPSAIDMPTMWAHRITNVGNEPLYTSFWTNDIFDAAAPDTIVESVF